MQKSDVLAFGEFKLDRRQRELRREGRPVAIGPTAFVILLALVEADGRLVNKENLISRAWGRSFVGDNRLHVHINGLRKLIGDARIITEQRRGYRFVAEVDEARRKAHPVSAHHQSGNIRWRSASLAGPSRLIGRRAQLLGLARLMKRGRLVTLVGTGGVGKTRLALHIGDKSLVSYPDGVWLVELGSIRDGSLVADTVATTLGLKVGEDAAALGALTRFLADKTLLLILDNCEHVVSAVSELCGAILGAASNVRILATSREALQCPGELQFEVAPLDVPTEAEIRPEAMRATPAVELFLERARATGTNFSLEDKDLAVVARTCRRLDGLPLAIEIVAGWTGILGLDSLSAELDASLQVMPRSRTAADPRHSTLRATLQWSYDLLTAPERTVLSRLAVFAGGFSLGAAKSIAADAEIPERQIFEVVGNLIRKCMVTVVAGTQRYRLLETTRAFALERLSELDQLGTARRRHCAYVLEFVGEASEEWERTSDAIWLARYGIILDDLRLALDWAINNDSRLAIMLAGSSWPLWRELSLRAEGRKRLVAIANNLPSRLSSRVEAPLRHGLGDMWSNTAEIRTCLAEFARAVALYRKLGEPRMLGMSLTGLGAAQLRLGQLRDASRSLTEALEHLKGDRWPRALATAYSVKFCVEASLKDYPAAWISGEKSIGISESAGFDRLSLVGACNMIELSLQTSDIKGALRRAREVIARARNTSHSDLLGFGLGILAATLISDGKLSEGLVAAREAAPLLRDERCLFWLFDHLALRQCLVGRAPDAARILGFADAIFRRHRNSRWPIGQNAVARLMALLDDAMPHAKVLRLKAEGALLDEDQALRLAIRD